MRPAPPTATNMPSTSRGRLLGVGRVVRRVQRREDPLRDLAARRAELRDEAGRRRPAEAVVVGHDRGRLPAELVERDVAETGVPLRAVTVEAEEVRRLHLERRVLRARGAVDERLVRVLLGVVGDRDRLVAGQRADHDVGIQLLHEPARLLDGRVRGVVAAAHADELERVIADGAARPARLRVVRLLTGFAPANCDIAATAPAMFCWSNAPKAPLHSDMIATLIGVPDAALARLDGRLRIRPRDRRRRLGDRRLGGCRRVVAASAAAVVVVVAPAAGRGKQRRPRTRSRARSYPGPYLLHLLPSCAPSSSVTSKPSPDGCGLSRAPLLRDVPDHRASSAT